ncbi:histidine kinase 5 [Phtheirospermum japonicum]|uniref:histidine kinase n=1 Tax=Phtheirospermum japonicum TaxID=374723 RepID=A0A830CWJ2_9LAMI|nr:histidine kinase 5 [Phtheirospermum japonicum]
MLATMSHEIRSPLSEVVSMAEILSTTNLDKEQRQLLKVMLSFGDLVLQLINDILDLSKVESGIHLPQLLRRKLAANWPPIVQIVRLISRDHMNKRQYAGKADFLVFLALNQHGFLGQLLDKKPVKKVIFCSTSHGGLIWV